MKLSLALFGVLLSSPIFAADIRFFGNSYLGQSLVIEGPIEFGDYQRAEAILRQGRGEIISVFIFSPGGDFVEAMKIGRLLRTLELHTWPPSGFLGEPPKCEKQDTEFGPAPKDPKNCICASAGFFIYIGGIERTAGHLVIHRPRFATSDFGKLSAAEAKKRHDRLQEEAVRYMKEMELPSRLIEEVLAVPSSEGKVLDHDTVTTFLSIESPSRQEWIQNRCDGFNSGKAEAQVNSCKLIARRELRLKAFESYFKTSGATLQQNHIDTWTDFLKYLGKSKKDVKKMWGGFDTGRAREDKGFFSPTTVPGGPVITLTLDKSDIVSMVVLETVIPHERHREAILKAIGEKFGSPTAANKIIGDKTLSFFWKLPGGYAAMVMDGKDKHGQNTLSLGIRR